ncbi:PI-PLC X domain-containing protein At5g67130-like [Dendrobium catenatum]|uniref:PI-PLC X domain-containing protein At5g67130-like n=1 Tax=Dendrobium catenatum TaxID=906689 RepID=UPI00109FFDAF|nr:PI-PLC X domain-containing protein At5g67130-like [Dendrobium catenatum]
MEFSSRLIFLAILLYSALLTGAAQVGDGCSRDGDCGAGLHCDSCGAICTRVKPTEPESVDKGLPFNRYSWLTTHNSFALAGSKSATGSDLITPTNQQDTVTSQLQVSISVYTITPFSLSWNPRRLCANPNMRLVKNATTTFFYLFFFKEIKVSIVDFFILFTNFDGTRD